MTREEAVKILKDHSEYGKADFYTSDEYYEALDMAISALSENKGEWIADVDKWGDIVTTVNGYVCSKCGTFDSDKDNFCPNCGADMRGKVE